MPWLFSYGSNHPAQLMERIGAPRSIAPAVAMEHKRVFRGYSRTWGGGVASLVASKSRPAYGYVAQVTESQLREMDLYEGVGIGAYARRKIKVTKLDTASGKPSDIEAIAYIASNRDFNPPSRKYLEAVLKTIGTFWKVGSVSDIKVE